MDQKQRARKKEADAKKRAALENRVRAYWRKHRPTPNEGLSQARKQAAKTFGISIAEVNEIVRSDQLDMSVKSESMRRKQPSRPNGNES